MKTKKIEMIETTQQGKIGTQSQMLAATAVGYCFPEMTFQKTQQVHTVKKIQQQERNIILYNSPYDGEAGGEGLTGVGRPKVGRIDARRFLDTGVVAGMCVKSSL
jgi:hypothetical protein